MDVYFCGKVISGRIGIKTNDVFSFVYRIDETWRGQSLELANNHHAIHWSCQLHYVVNYANQACNVLLLGSGQEPHLKHVSRYGEWSMRHIVWTIMILYIVPSWVSNCHTQCIYIYKGNKTIVIVVLIIYISCLRKPICNACLIGNIR